MKVPRSIFEDLHPLPLTMAFYHGAPCFFQGWYHKRAKNFPGYIEIVAFCKCHLGETRYIRSDLIKIEVFPDD